MSSKGQRIVITPQTTQSPLPTCNPNLMPFHIGYTGPAAVSMFLRVEKMKAEEEQVKEDKGPIVAMVGQEDGQGDANEVTVKEGEELKEVGEANLDSLPPVNESVTKGENDDSNTGSNLKDDVEMKSDSFAPENPDQVHDSQATDIEMVAVPPAVFSLSSSPIPLPDSSSSSKTLSGEIQVSASTSTLVSSEPLNSPSTLSSSTFLPSISSSALKDIDKRFISSFRGRTIHGLTVDLPTGYTGLLLQGDSQSTATHADRATRVLNAEVKSGFEGEDDSGDRAGRKTRSKSKNANGKGKAKETKKAAPKGRLARTAAPRPVIEPQVINIDDDGDREMADPAPAEPADHFSQHLEDDTNGPDDSVDEGIPLRKLIPQSTFSSITLWHADRAVDETRDEYYRTLTEWMALSHEVSITCRYLECMLRKSKLDSSNGLVETLSKLFIFITHFGGV